MLIASCDACAKSKQKWVESLRLIRKAIDRVGEQQHPLIDIIAEDTSIPTLIQVYDVPLMSKEFHDEESELQRSISVLSKLLQRYGLLTQLPESIMIESGNIISWNRNSISSLRNHLIDLFAAQPHYLDMRHPPRPSETPPVDSMTGPLNGMRKASSLTHLDRRPVQRIGVHDRARVKMEETTRLSASISSTDIDRRISVDTRGVMRSESAESVLSPRSVFAMRDDGAESNVASPLYHKLFVFEKLELPQIRGITNIISSNPSPGVVHRNSLGNPRVPEK
jgi:hypothetical protein